MTYPTRITVQKDGEQVFTAEAGRYGMAESACNEFVCFASPIIGAAYVCERAAANRIAEHGYETLIIQDGVETRIPAIK